MKYRILEQLDGFYQIECYILDHVNYWNNIATRSSMEDAMLFLDQIKTGLRDEYGEEICRIVYEEEF